MATTAATTSYQFTVDDLAQMPDDGNRYEVIDGELYVTSAPHLAHQLAQGRLEQALRNWEEATGSGMVVSGAGVIFAFNAGVIPDLMWISEERLPIVLINPETGEQDGKLHDAPDLTVEVLSPGRENQERDRQIKLALYSRRGVREYWLVDRFARRVEIYRREQAALILVATLLSGDTLASPMLPGFSMPIEQIFRLPKAMQP